MKPGKMLSKHCSFFLVVTVFYLGSIELNMELPQGQTSTLAPPSAVSSSASADQDELTQRLARLRQM